MSTEGKISYQTDTGIHTYSAEGYLVDKRQRELIGYYGEILLYLLNSDVYLADLDNRFALVYAKDEDQVTDAILVCDSIFIVNTMGEIWTTSIQSVYKIETNMGSHIFTYPNWSKFITTAEKYLSIAGMGH